jgi:3-phosphoshikimate 1-carboxyvinyltransferase
MKLRVFGDVRVPGDKSISHRALMLAAAASGESRLSGLLDGADCRSTAAVLRQLGCEIPEIPEGGGETRITGRGLDSWTAPTDILDCGNSGTTARLMLGLLAGRPFSAALTGDESLRARPMRRITEPLASMGASTTELDLQDRLPLRLNGGALSPIDYRSPKASAQIKSAILLAGLSARVPVVVREPHRSRDHTERMLAHLGVDIESSAVNAESSHAHAGASRANAARGEEDAMWNQAGPGWKVRMEPRAYDLPALDLAVPGDPSSAAFLIALALLADDAELTIRGVCLNPTRTGFLRAIGAMGANIEINGGPDAAGEPTGDLLSRPARLRAIRVNGPDIPDMIDEIPMLAVLAARAEGETVIRGAAELRVKESDRIAALVFNLRAIGAQAEELPDGLVIQGSDRPLRGRVVTHGDHRIAMAFGVLAALPENDIGIDRREVVDVSFPGFWDVLGDLTTGAAPGPRSRA